MRCWLQMKKIAFLGGVHGVGKTTFCLSIAKRTRYSHVTASQLIKEKKESAVRQDKAVADISDNQRLLIAAIHERTDEGQDLLIDGHFTLINTSGKIEKIVRNVFLSIGPKLIGVLCDKPEAIQNRIMFRDGQSRTLEEIKEHQDQEKDYGKSIAQFLSVPFLVLGNRDSSIESFIAELDNL